MGAGGAGAGLPGICPARSARWIGCGADRSSPAGYSPLRSSGRVGPCQQPVAQQPANAVAPALVVVAADVDAPGGALPSRGRGLEQRDSDVEDQVAHLL